MREIKFHGKRIDTNEWVYGSLYTERHPYKGNITHQMIVEYRPDLRLVSGAPDNNHWWRAVHPESVGQYIGLNDQKENEIYEDDILQDDEATYRVIWCANRCAWDLLRLQDQTQIGGYGCYSSDFFMDFVSNSVKIGNSYENPELLKP